MKSFPRWACGALFSSLLLASGCQSDLEQATLYRYCLGYDGIYITSNDMASKCCEGGRIRFGKKGSNTIGDWGATTESERAFFTAEGKLSNSDEENDGDFMVFYRTRPYESYKSNGCPMPAELSGVYNLETSANSLDQAEQLLQRAEFLDSLCDPSKGPCFYIDGSPTPTGNPTVQPTPSPTLSAAREKDPTNPLAQNPKIPALPRIPTGSNPNSGSGLGGGTSGSGAPALLGGSGGTVSSEGAGGTTTTAVSLTGEHSGGAYAGGSRNGASGGSGESGSSSDGSAPGQLQDLGGTAPDLEAMTGGDPEDYFGRIGKGDNLFKVVERRYREKSPEFRAGTAPFPGKR